VGNHHSHPCPLHSFCSTFTTARQERRAQGIGGFSTFSLFKEKNCFKNGECDVLEFVCISLECTGHVCPGYVCPKYVCLGHVCLGYFYVLVMCVLSMCVLGTCMYSSCVSWVCMS